MAVSFKHVPVMLREVVSILLHDRQNAALRLVDCTVGGGGHAKSLLAGAKHASLLGIDKDIDAVGHARATLAGFRERCEIVHSSYEALPQLLQLKGWDKVDGIFADLGVSSFQLDTVCRGFAFREEAFLDMRFDQSAGGLTAYLLVNELPDGELRTIFQTYGEEDFANAIASAIVNARRIRPIKTTRQLAAIVQKVYQQCAPSRHQRAIHPATKTFQALRIAVNNELACVQSIMKTGPSYLNSGGVMCVLTFHSLEDAIVKQRFSQLAHSGPFVYPHNAEVMRPTTDEVAVNPRARSVKARCLRRL